VGEEAKSPAQPEAKKDNSAAKSEPKVAVRGLVHMRSNCGARIKPGEIVEISRKEYLRLKADPRFKKAPFFQDVPKAPAASKK